MNKTIIITGGSKGIGAATALKLAQKEEYMIYLLARNKHQMEEVSAQAQELYHHQNIIPLEIDLTQLPSKAESWLPKEVQKVDILINNAGYLVNKPFDAHTQADWQQTFEVNFFSIVNIIQQLKPYFVPQSHILNIGSMGGFQGSMKFDNLVAYSASKAALASLTESLASVFAKEGIGINCLALGAVQTEMLTEAFPHYQAPLEANDMADFIAYFAQEGHRFFQGKILPVALSTP